MSLKINEQIMALRKQKGITQGELADVLGVSNQSVSKWESGQCCPDIQLLPTLAAYFEVSIDELMGADVLKKEPRSDIEDENGSNINDTLLGDAVELLGKHLVITTAVLQRHMGIGYRQAKELLDEMQTQGYVVEVKKGFYKAIRSPKDRVSTLVKTVVSLDRQDMLDTVMGIHAAYFIKAQKADSTVESAIDAVTCGQWGYSAFSEPDITTVMRGQSVFYSKNRSLDFNSDRIGRLSILLRTLSERKNLAVMVALYELTVHAEDAYVGIDEIVGQCKLSNEEVSAVLENGLLPHVFEQHRKYRIKGEDMSILPILSILCY